MPRLTLLRALCVSAVISSALYANEVAVRHDGILLSDGKPFFPIGLYYAEEEIADPAADRAALGRL